jgi:hypothetical protein
MILPVIGALIGGQIAVTAPASAAKDIRENINLLGQLPRGQPDQQRRQPRRRPRRPGVRGLRLRRHRWRRHRRRRDRWRRRRAAVHRPQRHPAAGRHGPTGGRPGPGRGDPLPGPTRPALDLNPGAALTAAGAAPKRSRSARAILSSPVAAGAPVQREWQYPPGSWSGPDPPAIAMSSGHASSQRSLTSCMPYTARPHECRCSEPSPLVKAESRLPPRYRCCPLLSPGSCPKHAPGASELAILIITSIHPHPRITNRLLPGSPDAENMGRGRRAPMLDGLRGSRPCLLVTGPCVQPCCDRREE